MIVTGAFFTDQAEDHNQKLSVVGGVWDFITIPSDLAGIGIRLVVLVQAAPDDYDQVNSINVAVTAPSGVSVGATTLKIESLGEPAENRYYHFGLTFGTPERGRYSFAIDANGEHPLALGLDVRS